MKTKKQGSRGKMQYLEIKLIYLILHSQEKEWHSLQPFNKFSIIIFFCVKALWVLSENFVILEPVLSTTFHI